MKIGDSICLNPVEVAMCKYVAKERNKVNRTDGVKNSKIGAQSDYQTDLDGIAGEVAFCKMFNVYPDLTLEPRSAANGNDTFDCVWRTKTIDVKTTKYPNGKLLAALWKSEGEKPDFYALMTGVLPEYTFRGFMPSQELLKRERVGDLGHGPGYIGYQSELTETI